MKNFLFPLVILLVALASNSVKAQVSMSDEEMSQGMQPAFIVEVAVDDSKLVENVWKDMMKDYGGKTKRVKGGSGEQVTTGADIAAINAGQPFEIFSKTEKSKDGVVIHKVWFKVGEDFVDKYDNREAYDEALKLLEKFALECKIAQTNEELAKAEKKLKQLENDLDRLKRQNDGYHRDIENYEKKIEQAKENIAKNEKQQQEAEENLKLQKEILEGIRQKLKDFRNNG
ncbi:MAG: hypothetical protein Kow0027_18830 [Saprospiraceae bacterium]